MSDDDGLDQLGKQYTHEEEIVPDVLPGYDLFKDMIGSINDKRGNLFDRDPVAAQKAYVPYVVNEGFSHMNKQGKNDSFLYAAAMNVMWDCLSKRCQYDFFFYGLPASNERWNKWAKPEVINNLEIVSEYYNVTAKKAKEIIKVLTPAQVEILKGRLLKGEIIHGKPTKRKKPV